MQILHSMAACAHESHQCFASILLHLVFHHNSRTAKTSDLCIPSNETARPCSQFPHSCIGEQFYIFPRSVHLFSCSKIDRPILEIYKSLTDICFEFSVQCLCSARLNKRKYAAICLVCHPFTIYFVHSLRNDRRIAGIAGKPERTESWKVLILVTVEDAKDKTQRNKLLRDICTFFVQ